jgi:1-aminocyclopropane-1-carboxylate deaminase
MLLDLPRAPLQPLRLSWLTAAGIEAAVLRLDLIDPLISGNKSFKLQHHLLAAQAAGCNGLISLGGAHSNHLHALAAAGERLGLRTVGLLRGHSQVTPTVTDLQRWGMELHWLGYEGYRQRHREDFWAPWQARYPDLLPVPEGGGGLLGAKGCAALQVQAHAQLADIGWDDFDAWWLAVGTGTTLAGMVLAEGGRRWVYGAMAVGPRHGVHEQVSALCGDHGYTLLDASRGGFARMDSTLLGFMQACEDEAGIPLEPVYTAKALWALREAVAAGVLVAGRRVVFVHTGGLQGWRAAP